MKNNHCFCKSGWSPKLLFIMGVFISSYYYFYFFQKNNTTKKQNKKIVYVDMVADLFHPGHVAFFEQARQFGDYLIVGLDSDEVCTNYKRKPIWTLEERVKAVSACKFVDKVIPAVPLRITDEFIDKHKIDVVVHGDDFDKEKIKYYYGAAIERGIFKTVPYTKVISTSETIKRILDRKDELGKH